MSPEKPALIVLAVLLIVSIGLLFVGGETAVWGARIVCVLLATLLIVGVWIPAKKFTQEPVEMTRFEDSDEAGKDTDGKKS